MRCSRQHQQDGKLQLGLLGGTLCNQQNTESSRSNHTRRCAGGEDQGNAGTNALHSQLPARRSCPPVPSVPPVAQHEGHTWPAAGPRRRATRGPCGQPLDGGIRVVVLLPLGGAPHHRRAHRRQPAAAQQGGHGDRRLRGGAERGGCGGAGAGGSGGPRRGGRLVVLLGHIVLHGVWARGAAPWFEQSWSEHRLSASPDVPGQAALSLLPTIQTVQPLHPGERPTPGSN